MGEAISTKSTDLAKVSLDCQEQEPVTLATGGFGAEFTQQSFLAQDRPHQGEGKAMAASLGGRGKANLEEAISVKPIEGRLGLSGACAIKLGGLDRQENGPLIILATGGFGADCTQQSLLGQSRPDMASNLGEDQRKSKFG